MTGDELSRLRTLWAGVGGPTPRAEASARRRLLRTINPGRQRRRRVRLLLAIAALLGLLVAMPALSGSGYEFVVHWLTGTPPETVRENLERVDRGAPPGMRQQPVVGKTGLVYDRSTPGGRLRIWLTPTKREAGGFCMTFEVPSGNGQGSKTLGVGCVPARLQTPIEVGSQSALPGVSVSYLHGRVAPQVTRLELRYVNGGREDVPLQGGFFATTVEGRRTLRIGDHPAELVGYADDGTVIARQPTDMLYQDIILTGAPPVAEVEQERPVVSVAMSDGTHAQLSQSPSRVGGRCDRLSTADTTWLWICADAATLDRPLAVHVVRPPISNGADAATLLFGVVREGLSLSFHYEDGTTEQPPLTDTNRFLVDLGDGHREPGRRLAEITVGDGTQTALRLPLATRDESLYDTTSDHPMRSFHQIQNPTDLPIVASQTTTGSHGETIELLVRRETPTHWYEVLRVDGTVVAGTNLSWYPGGHDATIGVGWYPMRKPEYEVDKPLSLLIVDVRAPATRARVVYADGSAEPLELARPTKPVGHGVNGWCVYEMTPAIRERTPVRFEALSDEGRVIATAKPPPGA